MRIAYISGASIPSQTANSIQVMKMCQAMVQEGHEVELIAPLREKNEPVLNAKIWKHYGISSQFPITWISASGNILKRGYYLLAVRKALTAKSDLIYSRFIGPAAIASFTGIPTTYEAHALPGGKMGPFYFRLFVGGKGFRRLVVISEALRKLLKESYREKLDAKEIIVAPDGVDIQQYEDLASPEVARKILGLNEARFTAGYTGSLYAGRGLGLILKLATSWPQVAFLVAGGEPMLVEEYKCRVKELGLHNVIFAGFISNAELPLYQAACEVLLMPYGRQVQVSGGGNSAAICSPMKMFEYMASGRLIISSELPVLGEVLHEGNSVLCDPEAPEEWQKALKKAIEDKEWRLDLGRRARDYAKNYDWRARVRRILN